MAHVCASTGWTWDYAETGVDLVRLAALTKYWADHPPTHIIAAAYAGIKPKSGEGSAGGARQMNAAEEAAMFEQLLGVRA